VKTTQTMVTDLHPDDAKTRRQLTRTLIGLRHQQGWTQQQLGTRIGLKQSAVGEFERRANPRHVNAQRYPAVYGMRLVAEPVGLPAASADDPAPHVLAAQATAAQGSQRWHLERRWIIAVLRAIREGAGVTQRQLAAVIGCAQSAIPYFESCPALMLLSTAQRYTRGLGIALNLPNAHLDLRLEPDQ
jgi:transcriptional regulator with XRE-family HTH domain